MFTAGISDQRDVAVRTAGDPQLLRETIRAELRALEPTAPPFGIITVEQRLGETVAVRTLQTLLLGALAAAGLVLGLIGAFALAQTIGSFLYETSPLDPLIYAGVAVLLLAVTTLACLAPTRRAARVDPIAALR